MTEVTTMSQSTLLMGDAYSYRISSDQRRWLLTQSGPAPSLPSMPSVTTWDPGKDNPAVHSNHWALKENPQGAIHICVPADASLNMGKVIHGNFEDGIYGVQSLSEPGGIATHFTVLDAFAGTVYLRAVHNGELSGPPPTPRDVQEDASGGNPTVGYCNVLLVEDQTTNVMWALELLGVPPSPQQCWRDTYEPDLRHSPAYFLNRILLELESGTHPADPATKQAISFQCAWGQGSYDPATHTKTPEEVKAGLVRAHGHFYKDQEPDDELKAPPEWLDVKGGLDDAGFPTV